MMKPTRYDAAGLALLALILTTALLIMLLGIKAPIVLLSIGGVAVLAWLVHVLGEYVEHDLAPEIRRRIDAAREAQADAEGEPTETPAPSFADCSVQGCPMLASQWTVRPHPDNDRLYQAHAVCSQHATP